jgi:hypothetical protein
MRLVALPPAPPLEGRAVPPDHPACERVPCHAARSHALGRLRADGLRGVRYLLIPKPSSPVARGADTDYANSS